MRKLIIILLLLTACIVRGQYTTTQYLGGTRTLVHNRGWAREDSGHYMALRDTNFTPDRIGINIFRPADLSAYVSISTTAAKKWQKIGSSSVNIFNSDGEIPPGTGFRILTLNDNDLAFRGTDFSSEWNNLNWYTYITNPSDPTQSNEIQLHRNYNQLTFWKGSNEARIRQDGDSIAMYFNGMGFKIDADSARFNLPLRAPSFQTPGGMFQAFNAGFVGGWAIYDNTGAIQSSGVGNVLASTHLQLKETAPGSVSPLAYGISVISNDADSSRPYVMDKYGGFRKVLLEGDAVGGGAPVSSVFGRTGAVTAQESDYNAYYPLLSGSYNNPSWITGLDAAKINSGTINTARLGSGTANSSTILYGNNTWGALPSSGITGTLTANRIPYATGTSTVADVSTMTYDPATLRAVLPVETSFGAFAAADYTTYGTGIYANGKIASVSGSGGSAIITRMFTQSANSGALGTQTAHPLHIQTNGTTGLYMTTGVVQSVVGGGVSSSSIVGASRFTVVGGIAVTGAQRVARTTVSDVNYTTVTADYITAVTTLTAPRTITLVAGTNGNSANPYTGIVKDESGNAGTHNITCVPASGTIDGAANKVINTNYGSFRYYYNGTNFFTY